ncbi:MAG TPA: hypothetical protein VFY36_09355 [Solirubrobacteraceae bacterium]|nr:hypothetical protein [Solirubrobacteraceae bacterium]
MAIAAPPQPPAQAPEDGLIDDARNRQRHRRTAITTLLITILAGIAFLAGGGSGGGRHSNPPLSNDAWPNASLPHAISVSYPKGWHVFPPPDTPLTYPYDRLLITSYPTTTGGGSCSPRHAETALPANGVLIYLFEYKTPPNAILTPPQNAAFPPKPAAFTLPAHPSNYECWTVPSYMIRFRTAGRLFQTHIALGPHASASRRTQALRVLQSLHIQTLPTPPNQHK